MKPAFLKIKKEIDNLDTESGNFTFLPMCFSPTLKKYQRYDQFKEFRSRFMNYK